MNVTNKNVLIYDLITEKAIKNYTMNGSIIIEGDNNYVYEITNTFNDDNDDSNNGLSTIDLGECESILKRENGIDPNIPLIILKYEKQGEVPSKRNIQFEVYHPITKEKLNILVCSQIDLYIHLNLDQKALDLYLDLQNYGYDLFNPNDSFYQDVCARYTTVNGTDVLLSDRRQYFFNDTETSCQKGCEYSKYNLEKKQLKCECDITPEINIEPEKENKFSGKMLYKGFYDVLKYSNVKILKCYKLVFSYEGEKGNYGSILMVSLISIYIIFDCIFFFNGIYQLKLLIGKILFSSKSKNDKTILNSKESIKKNNNNNNINNNNKSNNIIIINNKNNDNNNKINNIIIINNNRNNNNNNNNKNKSKNNIINININKNKNKNKNKNNIINNNDNDNNSYKITANQTQPSPRSAKKSKINENTGLIDFAKRIDFKLEENNEKVFKSSLTKNKYNTDSKSELIYLQKKDGGFTKKKHSNSKFVINNINQEKKNKNLSNNNKKNKEKLIIIDDISDNLSRNLSDNSSSNSDRKDNNDNNDNSDNNDNNNNYNNDIIIFGEIQGNDLNFRRSININLNKNNKSKRRTNEIKLNDSSTYNNDLISSNRFSRISSLNNSINNFVKVNRNRSNSLKEDPKRKGTGMKKNSKFLLKETNQKNKNEKGLEQKKKVSHCCIKGNNFSDYELNELSYNEALIHDKRGFFQYYWQLIRREHLVIFIFFVYDDFNILSLKLSLFIFSLGLDFCLNVFFFFDESMNKIYLDYGNYSFLAQIPQILYSSLLSQGIDILLRYLCLTEKDLYKIKVASEKDNKIINKKVLFRIISYIKFKFRIFIILSFFMMAFFWYFVTAFCAVYKNTQIVLLKDILYSFILNLIYPFGLYLIPAALRIISLKDKKKRLKILYFLSTIIPFI